jgi:hypothetical protein
LKVRKHWAGAGNAERVMPEKRQSASAQGRESGNSRVAKAAKQKIDVT